MIPNNITILGRKFTVKIKTREQISKIINVKDADGALNFNKRLILISDDLSEEDTIVTFLHECNHALDYITGFSQILTSNEFELLAETRAAGFYDILMTMIRRLKVNCNLTNDQRKLGARCRSFDCQGCKDFSNKKKSKK